jgi:hypothetical protein
MTDGTATLDNVYGFAPFGGNPMFPLPGLDAVGSPFTMTWNGPELTPGEAFTITGTNGTTVDATYTGLTGLGDPAFTVSVGGLTLNGILSDNSYAPGTDAGAITDTDFVCFLAGTRIATPMGEGVAVETLAVGDLVLTADGRGVPVKWIGRQTISTKFGMPEALRPVSIAAGALGKDLPVRDLRVTADHALLIDGVLVQAGALVNGTSIRRLTAAELGERFVVYHIETENHEMVLAQGAPAETFIDNVSRQCYDNYSEFEALYGTSPEQMQELPQPRAKSARQVPRVIRERIAAAAAALAPVRDKVA